MACLYTHVYFVYSESPYSMVECNLLAPNRRSFHLLEPRPYAFNWRGEGLTQNGASPRNGTFHSFLCIFVLNMYKDNFLEWWHRPTRLGCWLISIFIIKELSPPQGVTEFEGLLLWWDSVGKRICPVLSGVAQKGREREECVHGSNSCSFSPCHDEFLR
jgi:hypothetical protein